VAAAAQTKERPLCIGCQLIPRHVYVYITLATWELDQAVPATAQSQWILQWLPLCFDITIACLIPGPQRVTQHPEYLWSLTLWRPLLSYGYSYILTSCSDRIKPWFVIFDIRALWRSALSVTERQSARMSKITNDGLTRSGTGCFIAVPICGRQRVKTTHRYDHSHITPKVWRISRPFVASGCCYFSATKFVYSAYLEPKHKKLHADWKPFNTT